VQEESACDKCFFGKITNIGMKKNITELYSFIDDFCKIYSEYEKQKLLPSLKQRNRGYKMSLDEQLTVVIMYHSSYAKNFKYFYKTCIEYIHKDDFPNALSYNRFIALMPRLFMPLNILVHTLLGKTKQVLILLILPQLTIISAWLCFAMILSLLFFQMRVKT
jgi:hypothetical protein